MICTVHAGHLYMNFIKTGPDITVCIDITLSWMVRGSHLFLDTYPEVKWGWTEPDNTPIASKAEGYNNLPYLESNDYYSTNFTRELEF